MFHSLSAVKASKEDQGTGDSGFPVLGLAFFWSRYAALTLRAYTHAYAVVRTS